MIVKLIGPFAQILPLNDLPEAGAVADRALTILTEACVLVDDQGLIVETGAFRTFSKSHPGIPVESGFERCVLVPGMIDCHTHMCFAGSRADDYADRVAGVSYLDVANRGGGILSTVRKTRLASADLLADNLSALCDLRLSQGVTTSEVKSGYGLSEVDELKMLRVIKKVNASHAIDLISTCLAAHVCPPEFKDPRAYLNFVLLNILPQMQQECLGSRVDIYIDQGAFSIKDAENYLSSAMKMGFDVVVHADQFHRGGSDLASRLCAISADHLESSTDNEIKALISANVTCVALPGASLGLGEPFAPARRILDLGGKLAIASDLNPGSAPMGDLLLQAAVLGAAQKLTMAETWLALTVRAANALKLQDRGEISKGKLADFAIFACDDYREILYQQGRLQPCAVFKRGQRIMK